MLLQAVHNKALRESWGNVHPALSNQTSNLCGIVGDNAFNTPVEELFDDIQAIDLFLGSTAWTTRTRFLITHSPWLDGDPQLV